MHQQPHIDEFSVTDIRHTLGEVWRVVRDRKWSFLLPFMGVSTLALISSLWLPRQWTVSTIIRREHDPVLASMMGRSWTEPYSEIRQRTASELSDPETIEKVLSKLKLPESAEHYPNGDLTPGGAAARRQWAADVAAGLTTKNIEASPNRDVVSIRLTLADSEHAPEILRGIRDNYIARAQKRTTEILRSVEGFFLAESTRCRGEIGALQKQLMQVEIQYPGINPDTADPTQAEQTTLAVENAQLARQLDELRDRRKRLEDDHAAALARPEQIVEVAAGPPNPKYAALLDEIEKVQREIIDGQTNKMMTEHHPAIQKLYASLDAKHAELERTPTTLEPAPSTSAAPMTAAQRIEIEQAQLESKVSMLGHKIDENKSRIARIEQGRAGMIQNRDGYLKLREKLTRTNEELATWQQNIGPIKHILTLEDSNRGVHFTTLRDAEAAVRPTSPDAKVMIGICLAIGAAIGALVVLLIELLDRSFRTAHGISSLLGIPVIESIDEILTAEARKQRMLRRVVLMPAAAMAMSTVMILAGVLAYLSIESPVDYETLKRSPHRVISTLLGS